MPRSDDNSGKAAPDDFVGETGFGQLSSRFAAIAISLVVGAMVGFATVVFVKIAALTLPYWHTLLPRELSFADYSYSPIVGFALLIAALVAGLILRQIESGQPQGPADLIRAAQHERDPDLRNGFLSSLLSLVSLSGGASVGIFGPLVHFGGCLSSLLPRASRRLH